MTLAVTFSVKRTHDTRAGRDGGIGERLWLKESENSRTAQVFSRIPKSLARLSWSREVPMRVGMERRKGSF